MLQTASDDCYLQVMKKIEHQEWGSRFVPTPLPWFPGESERCVEVPWALSRYQGHKKILEIGLSLIDLSLLHAQIKLKALTECEFYGIDIVDIDRVMTRFEGLEHDIRDIFHFVQGNACDTDFEDNTFDMVFLISTLEHFGFDEFEQEIQADTVFKRPNDLPINLPVYEECREDRKALAEINRILASNGSLLLTVPMGRRGIGLLQDSKGLWALYKEYTPEEWSSLLEDSGLTVVEERFFRDGGEQGWLEEVDAEKLTLEKCDITEPTRGVACVELKKASVTEMIC